MTTKTTPRILMLAATLGLLSAVASGCGNEWDKCGGSDWNGATCCVSGLKCYAKSKWYSQCRKSCPDSSWDCHGQDSEEIIDPIIIDIDSSSSESIEISGEPFRGLEPLQTTGYYENWNNVKWWDNNAPGRCFTGCAKEDEVVELIEPYTNVIYSFVTLSNAIDYDYHSCEMCNLLASGTESGNPHDVCCPEWDGNSLYNAKFKKIIGDQYSGRGEGARVIAKEDLKRIDPVTNVNSDPQGMARGGGVANVADFCRIARESGKNCVVAIGGWSDWARIGTKAKAEQVAEFIAELVLWSFADGVDLDFEHLYEFERISPGEEEAFAHLCVKLREQLDNYVVDGWRAALESRLDWLASEKAAPWGEYHENQEKYLTAMLDRPDPKRLVLSYTTRFNAFAPLDDPWNFLTKDSPVPEEKFASHNEGDRLWPTIKDAVDFVNIMAYDAGSGAGPLVLDFVQIAKNFEAGGVPRHKIVMGFEPIGNGKLGGRPHVNSQAGGGIWEGPEVDLAAAKALAEGCFGGSMFWAVNAPEALKTPAGEDVILPLVRDIAAVHDARREACAEAKPKPDPVDPEVLRCAAKSKKRTCEKSGCTWDKPAGKCLKKEGGTALELQPLCAEIKKRGACDNTCLYAFGDAELFPLIPDSLIVEVCQGEEGRYTVLCPDECPQGEEVCEDAKPGKLVKPKGETTSQKDVASPCACRELCQQDDLAKGWVYTKKQKHCKCYSSFKKVKKAKKAGKSWAGSL